MGNMASNQNESNSSGGKAGSQKHERSLHHPAPIVEAVVVEDLSAEESLRAVHIKLDALQLQVAAVGTVRSRCYICNQVQESMMMKAWQLNIITYL